MFNGWFYVLGEIIIFQLISKRVHSVWINFLSVILDSVHYFDIWHVVKSRWTTLDTAIAEWTALQKQTRVANDKAMNAICSGLSPSEFSRISNCTIVKEAWEIVETTYEFKC